MKKITTFFTILVLSALGLIGGCNRKIDSLDPVRSLPDPLAAPINVTALIGDRAVTLTWEMPIATGVSYYRIYIADSSNGDFLLRDTAYALTQTVSGLLYNRSYSFTVAAVRSSGAEGTRSAIITVRIPALSIVIESNAEFTSRRNVSVVMNAGLGASEFQLCEDSTFPVVTAPILNFSAQTQFGLSFGDANKRVYARFYYADGGRTNAVIYDDITLDTRASISAFLFSPTPTSFQAGETITFTLTSGETKGTASVGFLGAPTISLFDDGVFPDATANDGIYTGRYVIPITLSADGVEVTGDFTDAAGNDALRATAPTLLTIGSTPPAAVTLAGTLSTDSSSFQLSWTLSTETDFESYRLYRKNSPGVTTADQLVQIINSKSTDNTDDFVPGPVTRYYRIFVFDRNGLNTGSNEIQLTK